MNDPLKPISKDARVYVAGHRGLVGSAIVKGLKQHGYHHILTRTHSELDLLRQSDVEAFFNAEKPDVVFLAAAKVGGILANSRYQADFLYENLMIEANVIHAAARMGVQKLVFLGSSCIYPKFAPQPIEEASLLSGPLEPTNEGYAIAKIAGLKLCEMYHRQYGTNFVSVMPTNLYGPGDNFDPENSHVIPGLMQRFHDAKIHERPQLAIWGTGTPRREFLHSQDLADALVHVMEKYNEVEPINVGTGEDVPIAELAFLLKDITGFSGEIIFDSNKPDGTPRKVLNVSKIKSLGWTPRISLETGLTDTYQWYLESLTQR